MFPDQSPADAAVALMPWSVSADCANWAGGAIRFSGRADNGVGPLFVTGSGTELPMTNAARFRGVDSMDSSGSVAGRIGSGREPLRFRKLIGRSAHGGCDFDATVGVDEFSRAPSVGAGGRGGAGYSMGSE
jgi:hypothetical protein